MTYKEAGKILRILLHIFLLVLAISTYFIIYILKANFDFRKYFHIAGMQSRYELKGRIRPAELSAATQYIRSLPVHSELFLDILMETERREKISTIQIKLGM